MVGRSAAPAVEAARWAVVRGRSHPGPVASAGATHRAGLGCTTRPGDGRRRAWDGAVGPGERQVTALVVADGARLGRAGPARLPGRQVVVDVPWALRAARGAPQAPSGGSPRRACVRPTRHAALLGVAPGRATRGYRLSGPCRLVVARWWSDSAVALCPRQLLTWAVAEPGLLDPALPQHCGSGWRPCARLPGRGVAGSLGAWHA